MSCAWAFPPGFIAAVTQWSSAPAGYSDTFTGDDSTSLAAHDSNWEAMGGMGDSSGVTYAVLFGDKLTVLYSWISLYAIYTASTSDTSQATIVALTDTATFQRKRVHVRAASDSGGYSASFGSLSGGNYTEVTVQKGIEYLSGCSGISEPAGVDHVLKIVASGVSPVTLSIYVDGDFVCTSTDSSNTIVSGAPGVSISDCSVAGNNYIDNWSDN